MLQWIKSWFVAVCGMQKVSYQLFKNDRRNAELIRSLVKHKHSLEKRQKKLDKIAIGFNQQVDSVNADIARIEKLNSKLQHAFEAEREKNQILTEITVPGLKKTLDTFTSARDYQTATMAIRTAVAQASKNESVME